MSSGDKLMLEWLWFVALFTVYILLMRYVLPWLGIPT
jgi:hypothetical protein